MVSCPDCGNDSRFFVKPEYPYNNLFCADCGTFLDRVTDVDIICLSRVADVTVINE